jgi:hypothetical protein
MRRKEQIVADQHVRDLQTGSAPGFEARFWVFQMAAWLSLLCLVIAGLSGIFGRGLVSGARVQAPRGDAIEYERYVRCKTPTNYRLHIVPSAGASGDVADVRINIGPELLKHLKLKIAESTPTPRAVEPSPQGVVLVYETDPAMQPFTVELALEPRVIGSVAGTIGIAGTSPMVIHQFVYP